MAMRYYNLFWLFFEHKFLNTGLWTNRDLIRALTVGRSYTPFAHRLSLLVYQLSVTRVAYFLHLVGVH